MTSNAHQVSDYVDYCNQIIISFIMYTFIAKQWNVATSFNVTSAVCLLIDLETI